MNIFILVYIYIHVCIFRWVYDRVFQLHQEFPAHLCWHPGRPRCPGHRPLLTEENPHYVPVTHPLVRQTTVFFDLTQMTDLQRRLNLDKEKWLNVWGFFSELKNVIPKLLEYFLQYLLFFADIKFKIRM